MSDQLLEKEIKTGDLRRRSKQAVLHLTFTELRITQMEYKIRKLEAQLENKPDDFQISVAMRQVPTYKSFIKRSARGEFILTPRSVEIPTHEQSSLEVLVADHGISATLSPNYNTPSQSTVNSQRARQETPERLRIRYAPLIKTLEKICRETLSNYYFWASDAVDRERPGCSSTILLRPWKLFVAYEKEIRGSIDNIDAFVEPARKEDLGGGITGTQVIDDCE